VLFPGFDGNNEHVSVAKFYIDQMERFVHFKGRNLNAHMMTLGRHRQMLRKWDAIISEGSMRHMTADQIIHVMSRMSY
jgi:uncharacterized protein